ncbi:MAG TPA: carbohydrate-binding protein [Clostridiales bacterium]|nr:carbohydrate-binding protein [Clostridiales bacterium]
MKLLKRITSIIVSACIMASFCTISAPVLNAAESDDTFDFNQNIALSRKAATEGMVLLKNENNALPLAKGSTVAIFGKGQIDFVKGGGGSGDVNAPYVRNLLDGMQIKENEGKITIYKPLADAYKANSNLVLTQQMVNDAKNNSQTAIVVISRHSGEGYDRNAGKGDYLLTDAEVFMLNMVTSAGFENVVVVLNIGGVIDTSWIANYPQINSVLVAWQPGMEGGLATADVLCGDVNPSGKLACTFAKSYDDYPSSATFNESRDYVNYEEDIFVGYRWFETFDPNYTKVNYEFGFGLSYTTFSIGNVRVSHDNTNIYVSADVKNTGNYAGKEVVQVYFSAPQGILGKPGKELAAFAKTKLLQPGETQTLNMSFPISDMSSYDDVGKVQKSAYILEAGDYKIYVGNSVKNAGQNGVRYTYKVNSTIIVEQLTEQVPPTLLTRRLLADGTYETIAPPEDFGIKVPAEGVLKIEAENYFKKHYHAHVSFSDDAEICGVEMYTSDTGVNRFLIFALDVAEAGVYSLAFSASNDKGNISDGINVYVNGLIQQGVRVEMPSTGHKWVFRQCGPARIYLSEGINLVKIEFKQGDNYTGVVDYFLLQKGEGDFIIEPDKYHTIKGAGTNHIEAEEFFTKHDDVGIEDITVGPDTGGRSLKNLHTEGYYVNYALDVEQAGTYKLTMKIANGLEPTSNGMKVYVNQVEQPNIRLELPTTSVPGNQWFNFHIFEPGTITLPKGKCILSFVVINRMGNVDYFELTRISTPAAAPSGATLTSASSGANLKPIMLSDVAKYPVLMDRFIAQLSDYQLAHLSSGQGANLPGGTGGIGNLPEFGIPQIETSDGPAGIRLQITATAWPVETLLACTWDVALLEEVGKAVGKEARHFGVDIWLAPGMNIQRNPLCGRNFEYYSEDPLVTGKLAAAITRGVQSQNVGVTIKHFAANNKETDRGYSDSRMSERALREIYLKGFEIAVKEAQPWCVMSSYNNLNGVETSENYGLLTTILRDEWGYKGLVMSDWWNDSCAYREVKAGQDVKMATGDIPNLLGALKKGFITRAELERNVRRVLELILKTDAFERKIVNPKFHEISDSGTTKIKAVEYSWKSSGIGTEACKDDDGGYNPTNTYEGNWLKFNIDVKKAGVYKVRARVASPNGSGIIRMIVDGIVVGEVRNTTSTGDWQKWTYTPYTEIKLPQGKSELKYEFPQGGFNVNYIELERIDTDFDITISPKTASFKPGGALKFNAQSSNPDAKGIVFSVMGATSSDTKIMSNGSLTIGADETAQTLIVIAASRNNEKIFDTAKITIAEDTYYSIGDFNNDNNITVVDIVGLRKAAMSDSGPSADELKFGDINGDNRITVADIVALRYMIMNP